ncbi:MAG: DUF2490 domain-containing protein [Candidatus Thermochlorobacter sp.]
MKQQALLPFFYSRWTTTLRWQYFVVTLLFADAKSQTFEGNLLAFEHELSLWSRTGVQLMFDSLHFSLSLDAQLRLGGKKLAFQTLQGRTHLNYHFSPQTLLSVGAISFTPQFGTTTNILLLQAMHFFASQNLQPALRARLDYRWQIHHDTTLPTIGNWRLRLQPILFIALASTLKLVLNNEFFFEEQTPQLIDENRFQAGLQWKIDSNTLLLVAYQNRAFLANKVKFEHTLFVVLLTSLHI